MNRAFSVSFIAVSVLLGLLLIWSVHFAPALEARLIGGFGARAAPSFLTKFALLVGRVCAAYWYLVALPALGLAYVGIKGLTAQDSGRSPR